MKMKYPKLCGTFLVATCFVALVFPSWAAPVPSSLTALLKLHEQRLGQTATTWRIEAHTALDTQILTREQKLPVSERSPAVINGESTWQVATNNGATLVSGTHLNSVSPFASSIYGQFYDGHVGMVVQKPIYANMKGHNGKTVQINIAGSPIVWPTPGDSRLYPSPAPFGLSLHPAHFVALAGVSPLGMYGAHWTLLSETPKTWTLEGTIASSQFMDAEKLRVVLSRAYGGAPIGINMWSLQTPAKEDWEITSYQRYKDTWVGGKIIHDVHAPGIVETSEIYTLQSLVASHPIMPPILPGALVRDYRLVAGQLNEQDTIQADSHQKHGIVYYPWSGQLPDRDELKRMHLQQNPGEATPDPVQSGSAADKSSSRSSSMLPFVGGLLCLVGGVWMYKRRGVS